MAAQNSDEVQALKDDLQTLRQDFSQLTESLKNNLRDELGAGADAARASAAQFQDRAREATRGLEAEVAARPLTSVAAAFGVGFLLGKLLDR
ncbi:hypothetical protein [Spectribacter hydrogenoxidans]|uniref:Membrane-anchored ribosome-binding protein, inhibits growth in stationary phase, ElaB/YqjD/DUF883 family n=1 Tax=Spectribacter hydrogenoxidans TaxID=3075608 RepID=A0ABU3BZF8_9GAMM|nr:hypothetical protein [Salinisphaera sp. W335]MDT0634692.1 hypothetical protein [Salinisphaera sp. W335]